MSGFIFYWVNIFTPLDPVEYIFSPISATENLQRPKKTVW